MNNLMVLESSDVLTMSSLEIAELTGKRHDNVMSDIEKMLKDLEIHAPGFAGTYKTARGNEYKCYNLPKRETLILVSGAREVPNSFEDIENDLPSLVW